MELVFHSCCIRRRKELVQHIRHTKELVQHIRRTMEQVQRNCHKLELARSKELVRSMGLARHSTRSSWQRDVPST